MAGIGFELRRLLNQNSYLSMLRAYGYAALIGSGPWVMSILAVMALGMLSVVNSGLPQAPRFITDFLVSVTWLVASSLILTGGIQLVFTRFVADRLYENRADQVMPNLLGMMTLITLVAGGLGLLAIFSVFDGTQWPYRLLMAISFVLLCNVWCITVFVAGLKAYRRVLLAFALGYGSMLILGLLWQGHDIEGLLSAFAIGQGLLLFFLMGMVAKTFPSRQGWAFNVFRAGQWQPKLLLVGFFYNLGIWADKLVFWFNPDTSVSIIGPLRASPLHDLPLFVAYLSIVPGMTIFLMRIETNFAENCREFDRAIRGGRPLAEIEQWRLAMVKSVRRGIYDIVKVQGVTVLLLMLAGPSLLNLLGFSSWYLPLFNVFLVAVAIQVLFMALLNVLFYLDHLTPALWLCALFCVSNVVFTLISQSLGPTFYGYGYAASLLMVTLIGLSRLDGEFSRLTLRTFMRQP